MRAGTQRGKDMCVVIMDGGNNDHSAGPSGHQFSDQAFAGAVGQAPVHQGQAIGIFAHAFARLGERGDRVDTAHTGQCLRKKFSEPFARFVQILDDERAVEQAVGGEHGCSLLRR